MDSNERVSNYYLFEFDHSNSLHCSNECNGSADLYTCMRAFNVSHVQFNLTPTLTAAFVHL